MSADGQQEQFTGWVFDAAGWSPLLVIPAALLAFWGIRKLYRGEIGHLATAARAPLLWLRGGAVALCLLLLLEPSCTRYGERVELPTVAVIVDDSQSMAVTDVGMAVPRRLDEAVALGLVSVAGRDLTARETGLTVAEVLSTWESLVSALAGNLDEDAVDDIVGRLEDLRELLEPAAARLAGDADLADRLQALLALMGDAIELLELDDDERAEDERLLGMTRRIGDWRVEGRVLLRKLDAAQASADSSLVNAAAEDSELRKGLDEVARLSRFERVARLVERSVKPQLADRAKVEVMRLRKDLPQLDTAALAVGDLASLSPTTDVATPMKDLADKTGGQLLGGVLLLGDGRITGGGDPRPTIGVLHARGAKLGTIVVGNPDPPRDAAVAEILGASEVYAGETMRLDVRFRVAGFEDQAWDLVLTRNGEEIEARPVTPTGDWQIERFECPADEAGVAQMQATLRPSKGDPLAAFEERGLTWEVWTRIKGNEVGRLVGDEKFKKEADVTQVIVAAASPNDFGNDYGARLRGYIVPPQAGSYVFHITGDDTAELWLSTDISEGNRVQLASVPSATGPEEWTKHKQQTSQPVQLRAHVPYYIEVLHKEGNGGDHVSVGWTRPDTTVQKPVPQAHLLPIHVDVQPLLQRSAVAKEDGDEAESDTDLIEASLDNNSAQMAVVVNEDPLKVLLLDAYPRWDSRYLVSLFERDRRVEVVRRYRQVRKPRGEEQFFPREQEELDRYDLVVVGDMRPDEFLPEDQEKLAAFVRNRGGFVVFVAGPRGMPHAYSLGALADLLPLTPTGDTANSAERRDRAVLQLTDQGREHPIVAVLDDPALNERLWPALPPLRWVARGLTPKPGAEVLLQSVDDEVPVVVTQRYGAGRICFLGSDETWRWRDRLGDRVHQAFWLQVLRWGLAERLRGSDPRLQVSLDRSLMQPSETAELRARVIDRDGKPIEVTPVALLQQLDAQGQVVDGSEREIELAAFADGHGIWRKTLAELAEGHWLVTVRVDKEGYADLREERHIHVRKQAGSETVELDADIGRMQRLAEVGGFRSGLMHEAEDIVAALAEQLEARHTPLTETTSLWNNYIALLLIVSLLLSEWLLRKRQGLP